MRNLITAVLFSITLSLFAQSNRDSIQVSGYIHVKNTDPAKWMKRYQGEIDKYILENMKMTDFSCDILAVGSSSINWWDNIFRDLSPMSVIRRSYGGATVRDMIYNYDVIARGYNPKSILFYVENDLSGGDDNVSVGDAYDLFRVFLDKLQSEYPDVPVFLLSIKPSPARIKSAVKVKMLNTLLEEYAHKTSGVEYLDITKVMYGEDGNLRPDIFREDNLHMNQKGYDLWIKEIKPVLLNAVGK